jgi:hypothetical protein
MQAQPSALCHPFPALLARWGSNVCLAGGPFSYNQPKQLLCQTTNLEPAIMQEVAKAD